jgi:type I restriction enzyme S subunit
MLPNKGGITEASSLPSIVLTQEYRKGDVLVSNIRPYFKKIWQAKYDGGCSNDVLVFTPNPMTDKDFLYYVLANDEFFLYSMATSKGTKMPRGDKDSIMQYEIPDIGLDRQRKIASVLKSLDDKIQLNIAINKNLEQQAEALYKKYFAPVDSEMQNIKTLDIFCNIFTGKKNSNAATPDGKFKFFTCSPEPLQIDSFIFDGNAIIVSGNGVYTGRTRFYSGKFDLYQRTYACTLKEGFHSDYIFPLYWFVKLELSKKIMGGTRGSAIPYIVMNDLAKFEFECDQNKFETYMPLFKSITEGIQANENQNETLAQLRDTLLPQLMSSELDVFAIDI